MRVQNVVGEEYGLYFALFNLSAILNIFLDAGIANYSNRKVAANTKRFRLYFENIALLRMGLAAVYTIVLQVIGILLAYDGGQLYLLFLLGIAQVFLSSLLYIRTNFTAIGRFKTDSFFSVFDRLLMIAGVCFLLYGGVFDLSITTFIYLQVIGYALSFMVGLILLLSTQKVNSIKLERRFAKTLLKKSTPYALIVVLMAAYHYSDSIMIERLLPNGIAQNAIYAQSFRILMALNNYAYLFAVLLLPVFSRMLAKKEEVTKLLGSSAAILIFGVTAISVTFSFFAFDIIGVCYGDFAGDEMFVNGAFLTSKLTNALAIEDSAKVFIVLVLGIIPMSVNYCFGALITAGGKMSVLNRVAFTSLLLNLILNFILIPQYGAYGAAIASVITQLLSGALQIYFAVKHFELKVNYNAVLRFILGVSFFVITVYFSKYTALYNRLLILPLGGVVCLIFIMRLSNLKFIIQRIKR